MGMGREPTLSMKRTSGFSVLLLGQIRSEPIPVLRILRWGGQAVGTSMRSQSENKKRTCSIPKETNERRKASDHGKEKIKRTDRRLVRKSFAHRGSRKAAYATWKRPANKGNHLDLSLPVHKIRKADVGDKDKRLFSQNNTKKGVFFLHKKARGRRTLNLEWDHQEEKRGWFSAS